MRLINQTHTFGLRPLDTTSCTFRDENVVIYVSGSNLVVHNIEKNTQSLVALQKDKNVRLLALSSCRKAVACVEGDENLELNIYSLLMNKRNSSIHLDNVKTVNAMIFVENERKIAVVLDDSTLRLYKWESTFKRAPETISVTLPPQRKIEDIKANPEDVSTISVCGDNFFHIYQTTRNGFKSVSCNLESKIKEHFYVHQWISADSFVVGSVDGGLHLVKDGELDSSLTRDQDCTNRQIYSLTSNSKYIVAGTYQGIELFDRSSQDMKERYFPRSLGGNAIAVDISPSEEQLLVTFSTCDVCVFQLDNFEIMKSIALDTASNYQDLFQNHDGSINDISACVKRDIVATAGADRKVEVFDIAKRKCLSCNIYPEEPISISLHPLGLFAVIGFSNRLRWAEVQHDGMKITQEIAVPMCSPVRFCNGGQFFAAASGSSINIYNTYTLEQLSCLRGHVSKVRGLFWSQGDDKLYSVGEDNIAYCWSRKPEAMTFLRSQEVVIKGVTKVGIAYDEKSDLAFAACADKTLKVISFSEEAGITKEIKLTSVPTDICLCRNLRLLLISFEDGTVQRMKLPSLDERRELRVHSGRINRIVCTHSERFILSVGEDSTISILASVFDQQSSIAKKLSSYLVTASAYEDTQTVISELNSKIGDLKLQLKYQSRIHKVDLQEKIKEKDIQRTSEVQKSREEHADEVTMFRSTIKQLKREREEADVAHELETKAAEKSYNETIKKFISKENELRKELQDNVIAAQEQVKTLKKERDDQIAAETETHVAERGRLEIEISKLKEEMSEKLDLEAEVQKQIEEDADLEIEQLRAELLKKLEKERNYYLKVKGELNILKTKLQNLQNEKESILEEVQRHESEKQEWKERLDKYAENYSNLQREMEKKQEEIKGMSNEVKKLRNHVNVQEKSENELKEQKKVLEEELMEKENHLGGVVQSLDGAEESLLRSVDDIKAKEQQVTLLKQIITGTQKELQKEKRYARERNMKIQQLQNSINALANDINDPTKLKKLVIKLNEDLAGRGEGKTSAMDRDLAREYESQREFLERTIANLEQKLRLEKKNHRADVSKHVKENSEILEEVERLREEVEMLRQPGVKVKK